MQAGAPPRPDDQLVADLHMAKFLHKELHQAFEEIGRGTMQTRADMLAIRAAQIDSLYQSLWEHLRRARTAMAALGRPTGAFDDAAAGLGPIGTSMGVLGATNTFGVRPTFTARGIGVASGGEVGATLNYDGARVARRILDLFIEQLPEIDWSLPPPRAPRRPAVPDLQVIDDGSPVESVLPPRRAAVLFWAGGALALVGVVVVVLFALRPNEGDRSAPPARPAAAAAPAPAIDVDELLALDTKKLGEVLRFANDLPDAVAVPARAELERRYLASVATDPLVTVLDHSDVAEDIEMSDAFFVAAARRVVALHASLAELDDALTDDESPRLLDAIGAELSPQFGTAAAAADTVAAVLELSDRSARFGDAPLNQAAIAARLEVLVRRDLATLDVDVLDQLFLDQVRLGLPADLVAAIQAASQNAPP